MQPQQMTTSEFANSIRTKYPTGKSSDGRMYSEIPDRELAQKIVEKYPVYKDRLSDFTAPQQNVVNTKSAFSEAINKIKSAYGEATAASDNPEMSIPAKMGKQLEGGLGIASGAYQAVQAPIAGVMKTVTDAISENPEIQKVTNSPYVAPVLDFANKLKAPLDQVAQTHPEAAKNIGDLLNVFLSTMAATEVPGMVKNAGEVFKGGVKATTELPGQIKTAIKGTPEGMATEAAGSDLTKINEMISPKPTVKQAKLAMTEGRLQEPTPGGLIKEGKPGRIAPSEQNVKSAFTIQKYIPDAAKMEPTELYKTLETKVGDISKQLKPEMQKVKIKPETFDKISSDWKAVKASQAEDAYMPSDVNLKKLHSDFETRIKNIKDGSIDDIWEARKAYDGSVPSNVKEANELSSESLQAKKDIWLENRKVFSDAINDAENGLGQTSRQAFSDMRDMYEAQNGLLSKAKVVKEGGRSTIGKVTDFIKENKIKAGLAGTTAAYVGKKTLGF